MQTEMYWLNLVIFCLEFITCICLTIWHESFSLRLQLNGRCRQGWSQKICIDEGIVKQQSFTIFENLKCTWISPRPVEYKCATNASKSNNEPDPYTDVKSSLGIHCRDSCATIKAKFFLHSSSTKSISNGRPYCWVSTTTLENSFRGFKVIFGSLNKYCLQ